MITRIVTHEEAEAAFTEDFAGRPFSFGEHQDGRIVAVRLPETPSPGGVAGKGYLPLTYVYESGGVTHTLESSDGPEVDEVRVFLRATLPDYSVEQRLELWFEASYVPPSCGCGCGCD